MQVPLKNKDCDLRAKLIDYISKMVLDDLHYGEILIAVQADKLVFIRKTITEKP